MFTKSRTLISSASPYLNRAFLSHSASEKASPTSPAATHFVHSTQAAAYSAQGSRPTNEDRYLIWQGRHPSAGPLSIFAVFDGHTGIVSANLCCAQFVSRLLSHPSWTVQPPPIQFILQDIIADLEASCLTETRHKRTFDGTTLCAVVLHSTNVYTANVGDSRIILLHMPLNTTQTSEYANTSSGDASTTTPLTQCWRQLTTDHKVKEPTERQRLMESDAPVRRTRLMGIKKSLEISRTLGDRDFKDLDIAGQLGGNSGLIATPDITLLPDSYLRDAKAHSDHMIFLLIATDGLSDIDFFGGEEIINFIRSRIQSGTNLSQVTETLVTEGLRYRDKDNSTAILVQLRGTTQTVGDAPCPLPRYIDAPCVPNGVICDFWNASETKRGWRRRLITQLQPALSNGKSRSVRLGRSRAPS